MTTFIPDAPQPVSRHTPFFEDSSKINVPGRGTEKPVATLQNEVAGMLVDLGATGVLFTPGTFPFDPPRYGFRISFSVSGIAARMEIAALPIRKETPRKKDRALAQALYLVRDWLRSELHSSLYRPGAIPLMPYLIGDGGETVLEALTNRLMLPEWTETQ